MARCNCGGTTCHCVVLAGDGVEVDGSGNVNNPYIVSTQGLAGALEVRDTATVDLNLDGGGRVTDPFVLSANAVVPLTGLFDRDPADASPLPGYVPAWQSSGKWKFVAPPIAPAGATNTSKGIGGTGTVGDPVVARTSGTWGTAPLVGADSTAGQQIYVDTNGQLRAAPQQTQAAAWASITGKPATFDSTWAQVAGKPTSFPTQWTDVKNHPLVYQKRVDMGTPIASGAAAQLRLVWPAGYFSGLTAADLFCQLTVSRQANDVNQGAWFTCAVVALSINSVDVMVRNIGPRSDVGCELSVQVSSGSQW